MHIPGQVWFGMYSLAQVWFLYSLHRSRKVWLACRFTESQVLIGLTFKLQATYYFFFYISVSPSFHVFRWKNEHAFAFQVSRPCWPGPTTTVLQPIRARDGSACSSHWLEPFCASAWVSSNHPIRASGGYSSSNWQVPECASTKTSSTAHHPEWLFLLNLLAGELSQQPESCRFNGPISNQKPE